MRYLCRGKVWGFVRGVWDTPDTRDKHASHRMCAHARGTKATVAFALSFAMEI